MFFVLTDPDTSDELVVPFILALRYVGKELAKELYNNGNWITMEDYFGIESKYSN